MLGSEEFRKELRESEEEDQLNKSVSRKSGLPTVWARNYYPLRWIAECLQMGSVRYTAN